MNLIFNSYKESIYDFACNSKCLALVARDKIIIHNLINLEEEKVLNIYPLGIQHPVFDSTTSIPYNETSVITNVAAPLGLATKKPVSTNFQTLQTPFKPPCDISTRFIAFAPNVPIDPKFCDGFEAQDKGALVKIARGLYDQLPYFSLVSPSVSNPEPEKTCQEAVGTVAFYDVFSKKIAFHFKPHGIQVGYIKWNDSGTIVKMHLKNIFYVCIQ